MSDIGFGNIASFIVNIVLLAIFLFVVPAAIWIMAKSGVRVPSLLLSIAKGLTVVFAAVLFVVLLGVGSIFTKGS